MQDVTNCGFVTWIDPVWPLPLKKTLGKLWGMYDDVRGQRIEENEKHAKEIHELAQEKEKMEEKYTEMVNDVNRFVGQNVKKVMKSNYMKIMQGVDDEESVEEQALLEVVQLRKKVEDLTSENEELKNEMAKLKEEKKKLEYGVFDLINAGEKNKQKLKKIKTVCEE